MAEVYDIREARAEIESLRASCAQAAKDAVQFQDERDALAARLAEVEAERDSIRTMLLNERNEWMDEAIKRQASVNEHLAALVTDAQEELRKCQQDAIQLQARLASAERERDEIMAMAERRDGELQARLAEALKWIISMATEEQLDVPVPAIGGKTGRELFLTPDSASDNIKPQYSEQFKRRVAEELEGFGDVVRARTAADQPEDAGK